MPFVTEELWGKLAEFGAARDGMLITAQWPEFPAEWLDAEAEAEIDWVIDLVSEVRSIRSEMNVPPSARAPLTLIGAGEVAKGRLARNRDLILTLGRLDSVKEADAAPAGAVPFVIEEVTAALAIAEFIDLAAEKARLNKEIANLAGDIVRTAKKLDNPDFVARAREDVVEESRERLAESKAAKAKLETAMERLIALS
jgi:valyl-tRNA synthetase